GLRPRDAERLFDPEGDAVPDLPDRVRLRAVLEGRVRDVPRDLPDPDHRHERDARGERRAPEGRALAAALARADVPPGDLPEHLPVAADGPAARVQPDAAGRDPG